jgi:hypothetical protein
MPKLVFVPTRNGRDAATVKQVDIISPLNSKCRIQSYHVATKRKSIINQWNAAEQDLGIYNRAKILYSSLSEHAGGLRTVTSAL